MKKKFLSIVLAVLCVSASSCTSSEVNEEKDTDNIQESVSASPADITSAVLVEVPINSALEKGIEDLTMYFTDLDISSLEEASYYMCASGAYPDEIAVMKFTSSDSAEQGKAVVQTRLDKQISVYESYTPDEMYKLDGAVLEVSGNYLYYIVTSDNDKAEDIVLSLLG